MSATFEEAARARGLVIDHAIADGKLHRVPVDGRAKSDKSGFYVLFPANGGRMVGTFGRWDDGREWDTWHDGENTKPYVDSEIVI